MSTAYLTTADLAVRLSCSKRKVTSTAAKLGIGINLQGRAGYRYTDADVLRLEDSMRAAPPVAPRRRRRAA